MFNQIKQKSQALFSIAGNIYTQPWLAYAVAILGGIYYLVQGFWNAHTRTSYLDEGLYLIKGLLFTSGRYHFFQDYGPWTNQMPLSYWIPGVVQTWIEPGLRSGRYFSIFLAMLVLMGLWILTRRFSGNWWAAGVVWGVALNTAEIKVFTLAISQVIVAFLIVWSLVLTLGENRKAWQIVTGVSLAVVLFFVRINLAPFLPLLILYLFWQNGKKIGSLALLTAGLVFVCLNLFFWPDILKMYAKWLPDNLTPFLDTWRMKGTTAAWETETAKAVLADQLMYFFLTFRLHFLPLIGTLVVWFFWPGSQKNWKSPAHFRVAVFLSVAIVILFFLHLAAAFGMGFCNSCILLYISFFDFLGLLLFTVSFSSLRRESPIWAQVLIILIFLVLMFGIMVTGYNEITEAVWRKYAIDYGAEFTKEPFWKMVGKFMGFKYANLVRLYLVISNWWKLIAAVSGTAVLLTLLINYKRARKISFSFILLNLFLIVGLVLTPTPVLSKANDFFACGGDVIADYEKTGEYLAKIIPPGSNVAWFGRIPAIFLYVPDINIYPPQLNHFHNLRSGGDQGEIYRFSSWSQSLGEGWISQADYVLVENRWLEGWVKEAIDEAGLQALEPSPLPESCREASQIHIFKRP